MNAMHVHRLAAGIGVACLLAMGGCAVGPGYAPAYGTYADPFYTPQPAYVLPPAYVDIDVHPRPRYWNGRPYHDPRYGQGYRPGYGPGHGGRAPSYRGSHGDGRPPAVVPPRGGVPPIARLPGGSPFPPAINRPEFRPGPPQGPIPPRSANDLP